MDYIVELYMHYLESLSVCTDSRAVKDGDLFFALKGDHFDGNKYAVMAFQKGARLAIVDDPDLKEKEGCFFVPNVLIALQLLAQHHRMQFAIPIIGLTGTNGKTTTKELLKSVLETKYNVHATKGNLNNHIGVPLTLLAMPMDTEIAIIEMGANHRGEIKTLTEIAAPTYGLITNIGRAHLEGFGSIEGVKQTKAELYHWLSKNNGVVFINKDEKFLSELAIDISNKYYYQTASTSTKETHFFVAPHVAPPYVGAIILNEEGRESVIQSQLVGDYNFENIKTALAIGHYFELTYTQLKNGIESYKPSNNRSQLVKDANQNTIILDAYNANPVSMEKALLNLANTDFGVAPKIAIIGDMLELGADSKREHEKIIALSESLNFDQVVLVGNEFSKVACDSNAPCFLNVGELKKWYEQKNINQSIILIKGSRGIQLEQLLKD